MEIVFSEQAQADIAFWKKSGNKAIMNRISALLADIAEHPFTGIGKPEPLKYDLPGSGLGVSILNIASFTRCTMK